MRVRGVLGSAVAVAVLSVAACTSDESGPASTPTSSAPSTSISTEPTPSTPDVPVPELPDAATVGDAAGAEAFVKHWVDVLNYAYATGDTAPVRELSSDDCTTCDDTYEVIDERRAVGARLEGGLLVADLVRAPPPEDGLALVSVRAAQEAGTEVSASGLPTAIPATPADNLGFVLRYEGSTWSLEGIGTE